MEARLRGTTPSTDLKGASRNPTIVLVHGAFAESSNGGGVIDPLLDAGHPVIAAANPLCGLASDAANALRPVPRSGGTTDLYITTERFHAQFCADVPE